MSGFCLCLRLCLSCISYFLIRSMLSHDFAQVVAFSVSAPVLVPSASRIKQTIFDAMHGWVLGPSRFWCQSPMPGGRNSQNKWQRKQRHSNTSPAGSPQRSRPAMRRSPRQARQEPVRGTVFFAGTLQCLIFSPSASSAGPAAGHDLPLQASQAH